VEPMEIDVKGSEEVLIYVFFHKGWEEEKQLYLFLAWNLGDLVHTHTPQRYRSQAQATLCFPSSLAPHQALLLLLSYNWIPFYYIVRVYTKPTILTP